MDGGPASSGSCRDCPVGDEEGPMKRMPYRSPLLTLCTCAFAASCALFGAARAVASTEAREANADIRIQGTATRPHLIFGCDRQTGELDALFTPALVSDLKALGAGV